MHILCYFASIYCTIEVSEYILWSLLQTDCEIVQKSIVHLFNQTFLPFQKWRDEYLSWFPQEHGNLTTIKLPQDTIWTPDLMLYNTLVIIETTCFITC